MAKENNMMDEALKKYFDQENKLRLEGKLEFSDYSELITNVAMYFAMRYRQHLMYWQALRSIGSTLHPRNVFFNNVRYVIDLSQMTFSSEYI